MLDLPATALIVSKIALWKHRGKIFCQDCTFFEECNPDELAQFQEGLTLWKIRKHKASCLRIFTRNQYKLIVKEKCFKLDTGDYKMSWKKSEKMKYIPRSEIFFIIAQKISIKICFYQSYFFCRKKSTLSG